LLLLDEDELTIPITDGTTLQSTLDSLSVADVHAYALRDDDASDPSTVTEAKRSKYWSEWLAAMHEELASLKAKGVYEEVEAVPPHRKPVQCKWVLHIKRDKTGAISHFKARLVAKGFTQIPGQDFSFTFAPVTRWDSIRSILCLAAINDFELRQLDVKLHI
jgi:Reverse transcriptase (RNA-dependent DNA polymerase)